MSLDPELQLTNTKPIIKNKLKVFLNEDHMLVLDFKETIICEIFHSSEEGFIFMHETIMKKIKIYASEDLIVLNSE